MDAHMLTTLGSALVVLIAMLGSAAYLKSDLKEDIKGVKDDLKEDIQEVKGDIRRVDDRMWFLSNTIIQHHLGISPDDLPGVPKPERPARDQDRTQT